MVVLSVILWTLALGFLGLLAMIIRHMTYWRIKGIPYIDTLPLVGLMGPLFLRTKSMTQLAQDYYNACPGARYFGCMDFNNLVIIIKDPEMLKEICVKSFDYFPNHRTFVEESFDPLFSKNIFSLKDERWREMRTILSPTFTASKMKYMFQLVSKCAIDFVQYLKEHPELTMEMDLKDVYTRYTNDVIATAAFGISVNSLKDQDNDFYINGKDATSFDDLLKTFKFIGARLFPKFLRFIGLSFLSPRADKFFKTLVYNTVKERDEKGIVRPDMINLLLQARDNKNGIEMNTDDITAQAFIFFLAGFDTSSHFMCFISHVLSHNPEIQDRLRDEVDTIWAEESGNMSYEMLARMKYMDMVLSEILRLYPPAPFTDRVCVKPYDLPPSTENSAPFTVQPNTSMWIPIYGFHLDPNNFPEPEKFDPERFSDENKNSIKPYTYMPFGLGPRRCIGDRFALMETKILMAQLLHNFVLKPSAKTTKHIIFGKKSFVMEPENGFWMKLETRKMQ